MTENRITGAAGYTYTYDTDGNRVEKPNGSSGTIYWYMSPGIVAESDLTGALKSEYVFFDGERVARKGFPGNSVFYYFSDHLKTAPVITDSARSIKEDEDYYPWGGELQFVNNDSNHYKFTSKERDAETQLDYFGARYYGNWLGRFIKSDWAAKAIAVPYAEFSDPQSLNLYSYVRNVPTSRTDFDGHVQDSCTCPDTLHHMPGFPTPHEVAAAQAAHALATSNAISNAITASSPSPGSGLSKIPLPPPVSNPAPGTRTQTGPYDVGTAKDLKTGSSVGDGLDVHHVPQKKPASQVIEGYDGKTAPAIAVPESEP